VYRALNGAAPVGGTCQFTFGTVLGNGHLSACPGAEGMEFNRLGTKRLVC